MKKTVKIIALLAFIAFIYYIASYLRTPISTIGAREVLNEDVISADAYIVRNETVYQAPMDGIFYSKTKEGERVGKKRILSSIYTQGADDTVFRELATIDEKISELGSVVGINNKYTKDAESAEEMFLQIEENLQKAVEDNDVEKIRQLKQELTAVLTGNVTENTADTLEELEQKRKIIEAKINGTKQDIYSTQAGIYSLKVDGYENVLTKDFLKDLDVAKFAGIKKEQKDSETDGNKKENDTDEGLLQVQKGNSVCKVIDNHIWYIVALVDAEDAKDLKVSKEVEIRFKKLPGETAPAVIKSISKEDSQQEKTVVVLECDNYCEGAFSIRSSEIEIVKSSHSGFLVPVNAIRVSEDGQNGVMVRSSGRDVFKPCKIVYRDDEKSEAIIVPDTEDVNKRLELYDIIVVGEK